MSACHLDSEILSACSSPAIRSSTVWRSDRDLAFASRALRRSSRRSPAPIVVSPPIGLETRALASAARQACVAGAEARLQGGARRPLAQAPPHGAARVGRTP